MDSFASSLFIVSICLTQSQGRKRCLTGSGYSLHVFQYLAGVKHDLKSISKQCSFPVNTAGTQLPLLCALLVTEELWQEGTHMPPVPCPCPSPGLLSAPSVATFSCQVFQGSSCGGTRQGKRSWRGWVQRTVVVFTGRTALRLAIALER